MNLNNFRISLIFPGSHLTHQYFFVWNTAIQALTNQSRQFDFSHIEPASVFWCVMQFKALYQSSSLAGFKSQIKRSQDMCVEIIQNHNDFVSLWIEFIGHNSHHFSPFDTPPLIGNLNVSLSSQRLKEHKQVRYATSLIFVIRPFGQTWLQWKWFSDIGQKLFGHFIDTNHWTFGIIRPLVDFQHIFHVTYKGCIRFRWNTPLLFQPGFELIFLSVVRIVS